MVFPYDNAWLPLTLICCVTYAPMDDASKNFIIHPLSSIVSYTSKYNHLASHLRLKEIDKEGKKEKEIILCIVVLL